MQTMPYVQEPIEGFDELIQDPTYGFAELPLEGQSVQVDLVEMQVLNDQGKPSHTALVKKFGAALLRDLDKAMAHSNDYAKTVFGVLTPDGHFVIHDCVYGERVNVSYRFRAAALEGLFPEGKGEHFTVASYSFSPFSKSNLLDAYKEGYNDPAKKLVAVNSNAEYLRIDAHLYREAVVGGSETSAPAEADTQEAK